MDEFNEDDGKLRLFIVRHGQTDHNVAKILQGHLDTDLNETGIKQAQLCGNRFKNSPFDNFYSSDLKRCRLTSSIINSARNKSFEIKFTEKLRERNMGEIEGMHIDDAIKYSESKSVHYREIGEDSSEFLQRLELVMKEILVENRQHKNLLLVSHGGTIRSILKLLNYNKDIIVFNTSVTIIEFNKNKDGSVDFQDFQVIKVGDTAHLGSGEFKVADTRVR